MNKNKLVSILRTRSKADRLKSKGFKIVEKISGEQRFYFVYSVPENQNDKPVGYYDVNP